ncbi:MAG: hypothetical protein O3C40_03105 [Planctomycetota bacterium]|nr:hypothetical protein [Planctomycetota bacterium]
MQKEILEAVNHDKLKVYVVWTPVLREDDRQAAVKAVRQVPNERATHFWDADKSLGLALGKVVELPRDRELAWDVYFAFGATAEWGDGPPNPAHWMHQLGMDEKTLSGAALRMSIEELLRSLD